MIDNSRCRALLLELIRRAIHDWVLYRVDHRHRDMAEHAYTWLFEEKPGHPWWELRRKSGMELTSFLSACEVLDLDPKYVRERATKMTIKEIMTAGRPAERRTRIVEETNCVEHGTGSVNVAELDSDETQFSSMYEAHYAVYTSS